MLIAGGGLLRAGFRPEWGNWKQGGEWFFREGTRGPHFHLGSGLGLQTHHLPWQAGNWARNLWSLIRQGKADEDLVNFSLIGYGSAVVASSMLGNSGGCGCGK